MTSWLHKMLDWDVLFLHFTKLWLRCHEHWFTCFNISIPTINSNPALYLILGVLSKYISTVVLLVEFPRVLLTVAGTSGQLLYEGFSPSLVAASGGYVWRTREIWPRRPLLGFLFRFVCLKNKANCNFCLKNNVRYAGWSRRFDLGQQQSMKLLLRLPRLPVTRGVVFGENNATRDRQARQARQQLHWLGAYIRLIVPITWKNWCQG